MLTEEMAFCQQSWVMRSNLVRMSLAHMGAQMAPVHFELSSKLEVQPYHITPWQCEEHALLNGRSEGPLRGDFFCLPFGRADLDDDMPAHGRTASSRWSLESYRHDGAVQELDIYIDEALQSARVRRHFYLLDNQAIIYDKTTISGLTGTHSYGHHAVLRVPQQEAALLLSTSKQQFGMTCPVAFANPANAEYQSLAINATFDDLNSVPSIHKGEPNADCSVYPARRGFTDLLQIGVQVEKGSPAWSAVVNSVENYLWFSLRDPELLPSTILWTENAGRHQPPWSGRNCSLGVEDVCSFFDQGSKASVGTNPFNARGIKTAHDFRDEQIVSIRYLQGVAGIPASFGHVRSVSCTDWSVTFADAAGREVLIPAHPQFVFGEDL
jgi:hypothetical protein